MTGFYKFTSFSDEFWHYLNFEELTIQSHDCKKISLTPNMALEWKSAIKHNNLVRLSPEIEQKLKLELL